MIDGAEFAGRFAAFAVEVAAVLCAARWLARCLHPGAVSFGVLASFLACLPVPWPWGLAVRVPIAVGSWWLARRTPRPTLVPGAASAWRADEPFGAIAGAAVLAAGLHLAARGALLPPTSAAALASDLPRAVAWMQGAGSWPGTDGLAVAFLVGPWSNDLVLGLASLGWLALAAAATHRVAIECGAPTHLARYAPALLLSTPALAGTEAAPVAWLLSAMALGLEGSRTGALAPIALGLVSLGLAAGTVGGDALPAPEALVRALGPKSLPLALLFVFAALVRLRWPLIAAGIALGLAGGLADSAWLATAALAMAAVAAPLVAREEWRLAAFAGASVLGDMLWWGGEPGLAYRVAALVLALGIAVWAWRPIRWGALACVAALLLSGPALHGAHLWRESTRHEAWARARLPWAGGWAWLDRHLAEAPGPIRIAASGPAPVYPLLGPRLDRRVCLPPCPTATVAVLSRASPASAWPRVPAGRLLYEDRWLRVYDLQPQ